MNHAEQKTINYTAPIKRDALNDPHAFTALIQLIVRHANDQARTACEGRSYTVDRVSFTIDRDTVCFTGELTARFTMVITPID